MIDSGRVTLTTIRLLAPHLTNDNRQEVLQRAVHKSKRDVELLVATLSPCPDVMAAVRKLPTPPKAPTAPEPNISPLVDAAPRVVPSLKLAEVRPLAPERYKIQVTVSRETYAKLRRAQDLLRHTVPNGDPAIIFDRALDLLIAELERTKLGITQRPRRARDTKNGSRHIPAQVRRMVWQRDEARCAFSGPQGRCTETGFLEYHHVVPFACGGETSVGNIELRCRAHNEYEAEQHFGVRGRPLLRERPAIFGS